MDTTRLCRVSKPYRVFLRSGCQYLLVGAGRPLIIHSCYGGDAELLQ